MILLLSLLMGCSTEPASPITEIGNPERVVGTVAASSLPQWIDTNPGGIQRVDHAWVVLTDATALDAECAALPPLASLQPVVLDLAEPSTTVTLPRDTDDDCGATLVFDTVDVVPDGAPDAVDGASVVLEGRDALDRPFILRSAAAHSVTVQRSAGSPARVFTDDALIVADLLMWTATLNIASFAADEDGVVRLDDVAAFDENIAGAFRITADYDRNGILDPWEIDEGSTAIVDPPLADADQDGLPDVNERMVHRTNPQDIDTDDDNLGDGAEVFEYGTDPTMRDTDQDGINDGPEVFGGTDPLNADDP